MTLYKELHAYKAIEKAGSKGQGELLIFLALKNPGSK